MIYKGETIMLRSFLPVGQGAFYREVFNLKDGRHTIIYDCGSLTAKSIVEQQIKDEFEEGEVIDAVFISHLDEDHINGLPFLIKYCKVYNLFFPLVTTKDKAYLKLKALLSVDKDHFLCKFIENPLDAINSLGVDDAPMLYPVRTVGGDNWNNVDTGYISSGENVAKKLTSVFNEGVNWELIPFNFRQKERIEKFKKAIVEIFGCDTDPDSIENKIRDLIDKYPNDKDKIKRAYGKVNKNLNTNTMTLFSGTKDSCVKQYYAMPNCHFCGYCLPIKENGCLYMGDYGASGSQKWKDLRDAYNEYWKYIGGVQIPHHGSRHNYNNEIAKLNAINIISAGCKNSYRHPHSSVIKDLILNDCLIHVVTENIGSQVDLKVDLF